MRHIEQREESPLSIPEWKDAPVTRRSPALRAVRASVALVPMRQAMRPLPTPPLNLALAPPDRAGGPLGVDRRKELVPWFRTVLEAIAPYASESEQNMHLPEIVLDLPSDSETVTVETGRLADRRSLTVTLPFGSPRYVTAATLAAMSGHPRHGVFRFGEDGSLTPLSRDAPVDLTDKTTRYLIGRLITVYS